MTMKIILSPSPNGLHHRFIHHPNVEVVFVLLVIGNLVFVQASLCLNGIIFSHGTPLQ